MRERTLIMGLLLLCLAFSASGCQKRSTAGEESSREAEKTEEKETRAEGEVLETEEETKNTSAVSVQCLTEPPELTLTDSLSSQYAPFFLTSGNYGWKQDKGRSQSGQGQEDIIHTAACGIHPLEQDGEKADKLHVPDYNQMDGTPYTVSCAVMPDKITVTGWGVENLGKLESQAEEMAVYEGEFLIQLKAGMVYELRAVWEDDKLSDRGFSGEAAYLFMTDGNPDSQTDFVYDEVRKEFLGSCEIDGEGINYLGTTGE